MEYFTSKKKGGGSLKKKKPEAKEKERAEFVSDLDKLFDILTCQCEIKSCEEFQCDKGNSCSVQAHSSCTCLKHFKIPKLELAYIRDQRLKVGTKGKLQMGKVDVVESARQIKAKKQKR